MEILQIRFQKQLNGQCKFSEFGTSKQPAQHWAEKSILENKRNINEVIAEELKRGLEEFD